MSSRCKCTLISLPFTNLTLKNSQWLIRLSVTLVSRFLLNLREVSSSTNHHSHESRDTTIRNREEGSGTQEMSTVQFISRIIGTSGGSVGSGEYARNDPEAGQEEAPA